MKSVVTSLHLIASGWLGLSVCDVPKAQITEQVVHQGMLQMIATVKPIATASRLHEQLTLLEDGVRALELRGEKILMKRMQVTKSGKE